MDPVYSSQHGSRIEVLDIMRGFALCGIIFANLMSFTGFYSLSLSQIVQLPQLERATLFMIDFLVEGKFYRVFAMLLGVGFALQLARFEHKSDAFGWFWTRRMLVLMSLGLTHMLLVWHGDILTLYSLLGLCLLLFVRLSNRWLLATAVILMLLPLVIQWLLALTTAHPFWRLLAEVVESLRLKLGYSEHSLLQLRTSTAAIEVFWGNVFSAIPRPMSYLKTGRPFEVLGQFILGVYLARRYLLAKEPATMPKIKTIRYLLLIGLILNAIYAFIKATTGSPFNVDGLGLVQGLVYHLGAIILALAFMGLLYHINLDGRSMVKSSIAKLAVLGRMSLTVYVMQTSLCVLLFYGYGLALMGRVPFTSILLFGTVILVMQYHFASLWLRHFKQGPLEWLWRRLAL